MGAGTKVMETTGSIIKVGYEVIPQEFLNFCFVTAREIDGSLLVHGRSKAKNLMGAPESYGNEKYYYFWVHKQCSKPTSSSGVWEHAPTGKF